MERPQTNLTLTIAWEDANPAKYPTLRVNMVRALVQDELVSSSPDRIRERLEEYISDSISKMSDDHIQDMYDNLMADEAK